MQRESKSPSSEAALGIGVKSREEQTQELAAVAADYEMPPALHLIDKLKLFHCYQDVPGCVSPMDVTGHCSVSRCGSDGADKLWLVNERT